MSTVIAKNIQIGTSGTATNNFTWYQPATPDGTVRLGAGNSGGTTGDLITANSSGVTVTGTFSATSMSGSGSSLTGLNASNLSTGTVPDARFPATLPAASGVNLTALNASNLGSGTVPDARFPATLPAVSGANLTNLNASNLASGTVGTARLASGTANSTTFLRGDQTWASAGGAPSAIDAIGTVTWAAVNTTSALLPGNTVAGSALYYPSTVTNSGGSLSEGANSSSFPRTEWRYGNVGGSNFFGYVIRANRGNTGYIVPQGATSLSGTWRVLSPIAARGANYVNDYGQNEFYSVSSAGLLVRIA